MIIKRYIDDTEISREFSPNIKYIDDRISDAIINVRRRISRNQRSEKNDNEAVYINKNNSSK